MSKILIRKKQEKSSTAVNRPLPEATIRDENYRQIEVRPILVLRCPTVNGLGCKVDLIEEGTLKPRVRKSVESEVVRAFLATRSVRQALSRSLIDRLHENVRNSCIRRRHMVHSDL
jgi:hypothetical protein